MKPPTVERAVVLVLLYMVAIFIAISLGRIAAVGF